MSCPIPGCTAHVRSGALMCLAHWRMVPRLLQRAVNAKWRAWLDATDTDARLQAARQYREARDAAVSAVVTALAPVSE